MTVNELIEICFYPTGKKKKGGSAHHYCTTIRNESEIYVRYENFLIIELRVTHAKLF